MRNNNWAGLVLAVVIGGGAFYFGQSLFVSGSKFTESAPIASPNSTNETQPASPLPIERAVSPVQTDKLPEQTGKSKPASIPGLRRPLIVQQIDAPLGKNTARQDWGKSGNDLFEYLWLSPDATRLITASNRESICWDATSGRRLFTFPSPMSALQTYIAPDARTFVEMKNDPKATITVRSTEDGKRIGDYNLPKPDFSGCSYKPGFTPAGDYFVFCQRQPDMKSYSTFHVVSMRTAEGYAWSNKFKLSDEVYSIEHLHLRPIANSSNVLLYYANTVGGILPARVCLFDGRDGKLAGFPEITAKPGDLRNIPGVFFNLSLDGRLLHNRDGWGDLQICDSRTGKVVHEFKKKGWRRPDSAITPDCRRAIIVDQQNPGKRHITYLYDLEGGELGSFDSTDLELPEEIEIKQMAVSRDGKTVALMCSHRVYLLDFQTMFDVVPLPPVQVRSEKLY
jgi:hypothetical protein